MNISDNYKMICDGIADAAASAGRKFEEIELITVTKFVEIPRIKEAIDAGAYSVGENRVQELTEKKEFFDSQKINVHFIGQMQKNKVKYVIGQVKLIHSVDRLALVEEIDRLCESKNIVQDVLIEVNIGREEQKGGIYPEMLSDLLHNISTKKGVRVKGLMCVPPAVCEAEARKYFAELKRLQSDISDEKIPNISMEQLSMGMSGDYKAAVMEGATMVRVGSAIFGARRQ